MDSEDMKLKLWAEKALMEAQPFLAEIGMQFLGAGKWDLCGIKGVDSWRKQDI